MKKYLFAAITLIVSLFGLMFINVLVMKDAGMRMGTYLVCGLTLGATRYVYRKYRDEENQKNYGTTETSRLLLKSDKKGFEDALKNFDFNQSGIEEFVVANGKEGISDFIVGIRTRENIKPDYEQIKSVLYKTFFPQVKFVFINMNEMGEKSKIIFAGGTKIIGKEKAMSDKIFLFPLFFVLAFVSCDNGHGIFYNDKGDLIREKFRLENGDSTIYYSWYGGKKKRQVSYQLFRNGRILYDDAVYFDSATGKRNREVLLGNNARTVREWRSGYNTDFRRTIETDLLPVPEKGNIQQVAEYSEGKPFRIYYSRNYSEVIAMQEYDSTGKIRKVYRENQNGSADTTIIFSQENEKKNFIDTLLAEKEKLKKNKFFPSGN